jgi:ElaB/YqjD/DUF883 family membrane-anchored ribosome-binding protein
MTGLWIAITLSITAGILLGLLLTRRSHGS